jgi:hypothetical protein
VRNSVVSTSPCFTAGHHVLVGILPEKGAGSPGEASNPQQVGTGQVVIDRDKVLVGPGDGMKVGTARSTTHGEAPNPADGDPLSCLARLALDQLGLGRLGLLLNPAAWSLENRAAASIILVGIGLAGPIVLNSRPRKPRTSAQPEEPSSGLPRVLPAKSPRAKLPLAWATVSLPATAIQPCPRALRPARWRRWPGPWPEATTPRRPG